MSSRDYYGRPLLKAPVWTWEVPAYFFAGGAAGGAAVIAACASLLTGDELLARHARWLAVAGALISPALLISDLGKPSRFLNMLRVFKRRSPMSVGAWTLVAFTGAVVSAAGLDWLRVGGTTDAWIPAMTAIADVASALLGLLLATYTGVLIGATVIPVWIRHLRILPVLFGASGLAAAVSLLELAGHLTPALNLIGIAVASLESVLGVAIERDRHPASGVLHRGATAVILRMGGVLIGPVALVLRVAWPLSSTARIAAAVAMIAGALCARVGWIAAGRASAAEPRIALG